MKLARENMLRLYTKRQGASKGSVPVYRPVLSLRKSNNVNGNMAARLRDELDRIIPLSAIAYIAYNIRGKV